MPNYVIPNLKNACIVLELLAKNSRSMSLSEIASELQLPKSSALRIVHTLESEGFLIKEGNLYYLGRALIHLGNKAGLGVTIRNSILPFLRKITEKTGETSHLACIYKDKVMIVEVYVSPHPLGAHTNPGTLVDVHCSSTGKVLLAYADTDSLDDRLHQLTWEKRTPNTISNVKDFKEELKLIRSRGYALDEEEYHKDIRCLAVPIYDIGNKVDYAIGITASKTRFSKNKIDEFSQFLTNTSSEISHSIFGYLAK